VVASVEQSLPLLGRITAADGEVRFRDLDAFDGARPVDEPEDDRRAGEKQDAARDQQPT
jgi:hypothetical protein